MVRRDRCATHAGNTDKRVIWWLDPSGADGGGPRDKDIPAQSALVLWVVQESGEERPGGALTDKPRKDRGIHRCSQWKRWKVGEKRARDTKECERQRSVEAYRKWSRGPLGGREYLYWNGVSQADFGWVRLRYSLAITRFHRVNQISHFRGARTAHGEAACGFD